MVSALSLLFDAGESVCMTHDYRKAGVEADPFSPEAINGNQFVTANGFRNGAPRKKGNVERFHTFVVEHDHMPLEDQLALLDATGCPYTVVMYSGNKSYHIIIRLDEDLTHDEWTMRSEALVRAFPDCDAVVTKGPERYMRIPGATRSDNGKEQAVVREANRVTLAELDAFLEPYMQAPDATPERKQVSAADRIPEGGRNAYLLTMAGKLRRQGFAGDAIEAALIAENATKCTPPIPEAEVQSIAQSVMRYDDRREKTSPESGKPRGRPNAPPHADTADRFARDELMQDGRLTARNYRGEWMQWTSAEGWHFVSDAHMQARVVTYLRNQPDLRGHATLHYAGSLMLNLRATDLCGIPEHKRMPCWLDSDRQADNVVAFSNGFLVDLMDYATALSEGRADDYQPEAVSPEFFSTNYVAYPWQPECFPDRFTDYLLRVLPDAESCEALRRMVGLLLVNARQYEVFWQLYGNGANGKTVALDIIAALVGKQNVSYVTLSGLIERFQTFPLAYSKVNICGELPTDVGRGQFHQIEGTFKDCVSGGTIEVERKGRDKYAAQCRAGFVMATNSLPTFIDKSNGIWRRLRIIPFSVQIPEAEQDVSLAENIIALELPGVLMWALEGLADVIKRGRALDCPAGEALKQAHRLSCDHERQFLEELYTIGDDDDRISAADIYDRYKEWMQANGYRPCGAGKFSARVEDVFPHTEHKKIRLHGVVRRGYIGLKTHENGA